MDKVDILLTITVGGFGLTFTFLLIVWNSLNLKIDNVEKNLSTIIEKLDKKIASNIGKFA